MKKILMLIMLFAGFSAMAKNKSVSFKTSAVCGMCSDRILSTVNAIDGVSKARFDMTSKVVYIKYNPAKTNSEALAKAISLAGYSADDIKADADAVSALPACCKPGSTCEH